MISLITMREFGCTGDGLPGALVHAGGCTGALLTGALVGALVGDFVGALVLVGDLEGILVGALVGVLVDAIVGAATDGHDPHRYPRSRDAQVPTVRQISLQVPSNGLMRCN
jgi:hypothetical protein